MSPLLVLAAGDRAPTLSSVHEGQSQAVRPEMAFGALARCFKCSAGNLEIGRAIGANSAKLIFGLTRMSRKGHQT